MTNFALMIWLYNDSGSALTTAMLTICSYAPYIIMSIFAGAISDKWNKKAVMLICDSFAAICTIAVFVLLKTERLEVRHLYVLNALNGLMNTIQSPASDVATTLLTPKEHYQKTSGMRSFSSSLVSIFTPVIATSIVSFAGVEVVIIFDLITFVLAFLVLLLFIRIPAPKSRVKVICNCLLISMSTENFLLAFGRSTIVWCIGAIFGWLSIPLMNANMNVIFRSQIPADM